MSCPSLYALLHTAGLFYVRGAACLWFASKIMNHLPDSGLQQDKSGIGIPIDRVIEFPNHNLWY